MENEKIINYKLVIVEWVEVQTSLENIHIDDLKDIRAPINVSVGFLLRKTNKNITIGFSMNTEKWIKQFQIIPRDLIKSMIILPPHVYQNFDSTPKPEESSEENKALDTLIDLETKKPQSPLNQTLNNAFTEE